MVAIDQIKLVDPSVPAALFRLLQRDEALAYLREGDGIYGFEVHHDSPDISGFALIGMSKHTIIAYKSDIGEPPRLVLFPDVEKLFDDSFGLLDLECTKKFFTDDSFKGRKIESGAMKHLVRDLLPPMKTVPDLSEELSFQITRIMSAEYNDADAQDVKAYRPEFKDGSKAKSVAVAPKPVVKKVEEPKVEIRKHPKDSLADNESKFKNVEEVIDFCVVNHAMDRVVLDKLYQAMVDNFTQRHKDIPIDSIPKEFVSGYIKLVVKAVNQDKLRWE